MIGILMTIADDAQYYNITVFRAIVGNKCEFVNKNT